MLANGDSRRRLSRAAATLGLPGVLHLGERPRSRYAKAMRGRLNDTDVREGAYRRLLAHASACPNTRIVDELGLGHGACRVDIAVINGHIRGLEIKSDLDVLDRLPHQVAAYGKVVDKATLLVAPRHLDAAMTILPDWWGVMVVEPSPTSVRFRKVRSERANRGVDPMMVARLLWHPEAAGLLRSMGKPESFLRRPRENLYRELVALVPRRELAHHVREILKAREGWRDRRPPS
jgi:hypothetical protein